MYDSLTANRPNGTRARYLWKILADVNSSGFNVCEKMFANYDASNKNAVLRRWIPIRRAYGNQKQDN
jgi:hypothetical protein